MSVRPRLGVQPRAARARCFDPAWRFARLGGCDALRRELLGDMFGSSQQTIVARCVWLHRKRCVCDRTRTARGGPIWSPSDAVVALLYRVAGSAGDADIEL